MPNALAYLALIASPFVVWYIFRRLDVPRALIWSILLTYLFLPEPPAAFDWPLLPPMDKDNIPVVAAFFLALWRSDSTEPLMPRNGFVRVLLIVFLLVPVPTALSNLDAIRFGSFTIPGLKVKDALALVLQQFMLVLPFLLARRHLASAGSLQDLMRAFVIAGLVYSVLMLIEVRLSPQLNLWVYGYFQHYFAQTIRFGGFRPMVFLQHGIWVAFFAMTATVAAFALWRQAYRGKAGVMRMGVALYLFAVLVLAKSFGALLFALVLVPLVLLVGQRMQLRVAMLIALVTLSYPLTKGLQLVPEQRIITQVREISEDRAGSIMFRFHNENILLDRAAQKPLFGWGSWGRNQVYDTQSGRRLSVTDGRWIITIGVYGWIGFLAEFGLLLVPIFMIARQMAGSDDVEISPLVGPACLLLAVNVMDLLPNATLTQLTWLLAGCLVGYAERLGGKRLQVQHERALQRWKSIL